LSLRRFAVPILGPIELTPCQARMLVLSYRLRSLNADRYAVFPNTDRTQVGRIVNVP